MTEHPDPLDPYIARLREPVEITPDLVRRVMVDVRAIGAPDGVTEPSPPGRWWRRRWTVEVTPLRALAAAAMVVVAVGAGRVLGRTGSPPQALVAAVPADELRQTQFLLVAPEAARVAVVGDFNDWSTAATPLARANGDGVWWVTVPLAPGRYRYAFVVDGTVWRPDPEAPAIDDEFGRASSVLTIGGT